MNIAFTSSPQRGGIDPLLHRVAQALSLQGLRVCGTAQVNIETGGGGACDMEVRILPDGPVIRISQSLGPQSKGCRLDPSALECAVELVRKALHEDVDVLILNKFGKHEAEGRGFREVIAEAAARDVPVLLGVNTLNRGAFDAFCGGLAEELPPDLDALMAWVGARLAA